MKPSQSLAFFVPAFNEADNLSSVVKRIYDFCDSHHLLDRSVIVVNDGSTDHTEDTLKVLRHNHDVTVISHITNRGYGAALRSGLSAALLTNHDWIVFCDGDGQFDPMDASLLLSAVHETQADVAIGYREQRADSLHRRFMGRAWHRLSSVVLGYTAIDVDCGFKLFSRESIASIEQSLCGDHATISPELLTRLQRAGFKIVEQPVPHYPRAHGAQTGASFHVMWSSFTGLLNVRKITRKETSVYIGTESLAS